MENQSSRTSIEGRSAPGAGTAAHTKAPATSGTRKPSSAQAYVEGLLAKAGITLNGREPWDMQVHDKRAFDRIIAGGSLGLGQSYMDGLWDCQRLDEFFCRIVGAELNKHIRVTPDVIVLAINAALRNRQNKSRVWQAADVHYNLPYKIFEATFDKRLTGSCGYWAEAKDLDAAQDAKLDLICRKIGLRPGMTPRPRILDIGCGWGAFMGFAAEKYGVECVGVTVSSEQVKYAMDRYKHLPIESRLQDYREFNEPVDHIVSMGMFEHVGSKNYRAYFEMAHRVLKPGGLFLLHTIWGNYKAPHIDPWLDKYIFPNGVIPTVGEITTAVEGLFVVEDVHNFGADYDKTLMAWNEKFQGNRRDIAAELGETFCRMWEYYLLCCAGGFRSRGISVGHFVLSPKGVPGVYKTVR